MEKRSTLISTRKLADILSVDIPVIYKLVKDRKIPFYTVGGQYRFNKKDVLQALQNSILEEEFSAYRMIDGKHRNVFWRTAVFRLSDDQNIEGLLWLLEFKPEVMTWNELRPMSVLVRRIGTLEQNKEFFHLVEILDEGLVATLHFITQFQGVFAHDSFVWRHLFRLEKIKNDFRPRRISI